MQGASFALGRFFSVFYCPEQVLFALHAVLQRIECADAVLPGGRIGRVPQALRLAGAARRMVRQNLAWALFYNLICIPVAACGIVNPSIAAAAMTLSSNGILLHSLRLNKAEASE